MRALLWLLLAAAIALVAWLIVRPADAHDFYTGLQNANHERCCGGTDCRPVTAAEVRGSPVTGFEILDAATHEWLPVPDKAILVDARSPDGRLHACIWGGEVKCVILPGML